MTSSTRAETPVLAVGAIVVIDRHLLLVERGQPPGVGLWSVPGGRVEAGELVGQAVEREVLEETGLAVSCGPLVGWVQRIGVDYNFVILDFAATPVEPAEECGPKRHHSLQPGDDANAARWVAFESLAELPLVPGLLSFLGQHGVVPADYSSSSPVGPSESDSPSA